jgi:phthalate 4,5-dioxygenase oxygenase subunit
VIDLDCNFSKGLESLLDSSHVSLLHEDSMRRSARFRSTISSNPSSGAIDPAPQLRVETTDFGFHYVSLREAAAGRVQARLSVYVAPYLCFVAPQDSAFLSVPLDDLHTRLYLIAWSPRIPITPALRADWVRFMGLEPAVLEACGLARRAISEGSLSDSNNFVQDRKAMKTRASYSGLPGLMAEDAAMITSIPGISDYSGEHLTASDAAVVQLRRILWRIARSGEETDRPLPVAIPANLKSETLNSASGMLASADDWRTIAPYLRQTADGAMTDIAVTPQIP